MSVIATQVHSILLELFPSKPFKQVFCEHYVKYKGHRLFFDFYIKKIGVLIEVQGQQHTKFVSHFHSDRKAFLQQKERDNLKRIWAEESGNYLIRINYDEDVTEDLIMNKINKAIESEVGFYE